MARLTLTLTTAWFISCLLLDLHILLRRGWLTQKRNQDGGVLFIDLLRSGGLVFGRFILACMQSLHVGLVPFRTNPNLTTDHGSEEKQNKTLSMFWCDYLQDTGKKRSVHESLTGTGGYFFMLRSFSWWLWFMFVRVEKIFLDVSLAAY